MAKISTHCLVCNEERWIWFAIMSVINHVDEILVWDTGSTDDTVSIIKSINSPKIKFRQMGLVDLQGFTDCRNEMLKQTESDWILILDGDEIWSDKAIRNSILLLDNNLEFIVNRNYNLVGDIFHYQEEQASNYKIGSYSGHINIRFVNRNIIPGLHFEKPYGQEGLYDEQGVRIQDRRPQHAEIINDRYLHTTHLVRSSKAGAMKRDFKYKHELGIPIPREFEFPSVFYLPTDKQVFTPWKKRTPEYVFNATFQTPLKFVKRRFQISKQIGY